MSNSFASVALPSDLAATIARAGVDVTLPERELEEAIRVAITDRRGYLDSWHCDHAGWCVTLLHPIREEYRGVTLAAALGWCVIYLMGEAGEIGIGGFAG